MTSRVSNREGKSYKIYTLHYAKASNDNKTDEPDMHKLLLNFIDITGFTKGRPQQ